ncbi:MAG TPA: hypothetical protein VLX90_03465 [Steroidobacteraceae bacterium]|nr:hypothetical protein [Steroidobacteraceae bacterium]
MQVEALAIRLRPRDSSEAADLGVRLCQAAAGSIVRCHGPVVAVVILLSLACFDIAPWLPGLLLWCSKPWLDRTILFVLSRAAFGQTTGARELWEARGEVWWRQLLRSWTWRRLSPWRSFTQPVYQLEGLTGLRLRRRVAQIRVGRSSAAAGMTSVFSCAETVLLCAVLSLAYWLAPKGYSIDFMKVLTGDATRPLDFAVTTAYAVVIAFLEPFYVAAGFAMYLNRRAELEAWDIEQEFRRAFAP